MPDSRSGWLLTTINAVRELMVQRLEKHSLDPDSEREMQMALEEIEVMWEELVGQADLLSREHRRYQEFFEFAPDAYTVTDAGCNIREANRAMSDLLCTSRADMLGKPLSNYVAEADRTRFLSNFIGLVVQPVGKPAGWRCHLQPAKAPEIEVAITVRAIPLRKSGVGGLCWLIRPL
jgi:PAS domain-containing protein